jgi:hypothetical protein
MTNSQSATALTPHAFDEEAFEELAALADEAEYGFDLNAIDRGFERLIEQPTRKTAGKTLAGRLVRDAKKFLRSNRRREILSDGIETNDCRFAPPTDMELEDIRLAVAVVRDGLMSLDPRDRLVLWTKATAGDPEALDVKPRQFRNLVTMARARLWQQSGIEMACMVIMDGLDRWRFETIELMASLAAWLVVPA